MGEAAGIKVSGLAMAGFVQFWNSKTGDEGYTTRPLCRYADGVRAWLHRHMVSLGRSSDMLVWQSGEAGLEACMAETLAGTAYAHASWHALRRGGAAASWARKPDLTYYKWWGRWQSTVGGGNESDPHFSAFFRIFSAFSPSPGLCLPKRRCIVRLCLFIDSIHSLTGSIRFPCV